jgi:hypothetical protein
MKGVCVWPKGTSRNLSTIEGISPNEVAATASKAYVGGWKTVCFISIFYCPVTSL